MFEGSHLPLMSWFKAMELVFSQPDITVKEVQRAIRTSYKTAWIVRKLILGLPEHDQRGHWRGPHRQRSTTGKPRRWIRHEDLLHYPEQAHRSIDQIRRSLHGLLLLIS